MNKPLTVAYEDFKQELADLINHAGLPAFMIGAVLQQYLEETVVVMQRQYQADKAQYEKATNLPQEQTDKTQYEKTMDLPQEESKQPEPMQEPV